MEVVVVTLNELFLILLDPPEDVQLETSAVNNKACKGDVISINCSADANPSVTSYELLENDTVILDTSGRWSKTLTTGGVFIYKCVANNSVGTQQSSSVTIYVNGNILFSFAHVLSWAMMAGYSCVQHSIAAVYTSSVEE